MTDIKVVVEELHNHAGNVGRLADRVQNCQRFGSEVDFGLHTFGIVGQAFALGCRQESQNMAQTLGKAAESVRDVSKGLQETGDTYHGTETDNTNLFAGGDD
ncbi:WXG100 family type VII secretion target [Gandjariella thermophila]|uniref:ESX-1 secretion-associated protein n=1 Tax=Gandjariella thermophila TaxID=1931992 RepID=A0A4D4IXH8_9PSEU|nr:type VII secretion target [Gandjariella thermophila]GDY28911.1 hypothetical protein GTS_05440 [Gandjariella thermophila]